MVEYRVAQLLTDWLIIAEEKKNKIVAPEQRASMMPKRNDAIVNWDNPMVSCSFLRFWFFKPSLAMLFHCYYYLFVFLFLVECASIVWLCRFRCNIVFFFFSSALFIYTVDSVYLDSGLFSSTPLLHILYLFIILYVMVTEVRVFLDLLWS